MSITQFMDHNFRHFNARETLAAARALKRHVDDGGKMLVALAGAKSTGKLGVSLAKMIRADKIHAICCTAANLEEDIFNLLANETYRIVPNYRELSVTDELALRDAGFNRVTDTCIPERVFRAIEGVLKGYWTEASETNASYFPYEHVYRLVDDAVLESPPQMPLEESWVLAVHEKRLAIALCGSRGMVVIGP